MLRPHDLLPFDNPQDPTILDELVALLGMTPVQYTEKLLCCGGGLRVSSTPTALSFARRKLIAARAQNADCMVVACPYCMVQFDLGQPEINELFGENISLPVLYYTELLGLGIGCSPEELGIIAHAAHNEGIREFLHHIQPTAEAEPIAETEISTKLQAQLRLCARCLACADDCPAAMTTDYNPEGIIKDALEGSVDALLARGDLWYCMNCQECVHRCPQGVGFVNVLAELKNLAAAKGICPMPLKARVADFAASGYAFPPDAAARDALGLPPLQPAPAEVISRLLDSTLQQHTRHVRKVDESA
jgi:heterodisulfide reductase subunit C